jgi:hypothetical protein
VLRGARGAVRHPTARSASLAKRIFAASTCKTARCPSVTKETVRTSEDRTRRRSWQFTRRSRPKILISPATPTQESASPPTTHRARNPRPASTLGSCMETDVGHRRWRCRGVCLSCS